MYITIKFIVQMKNTINSYILVMLFYLAMANTVLAENNTGKTVKKPNIVFIMADDLGYTDVSCMGSLFYETPNIDRIANHGMVFTDGYACSSVCSPSRASIMTGMFSARHGVTDWIGEASGEAWRTAGEAWGLKNRHTPMLPADYVHNLPLEYLTLPEALKEQGYKTFIAGKWHLGGKGSLPEDHGFDINKGAYFAGVSMGGHFSPYRNPTLPDGPDGENLQMRLAHETIDFIRENSQSPFFAYLSFYAVHLPLQTTKEKWEKYRDKAEKMGIDSTGFAMERRLPYRLHQDNPVYAGLIESMDDAIGMVLKALKELGLDNNTIVIFTSDNGGVISGDDSSTSNAPLRGGKGYQWEGGIREPYFISVPWMNLSGSKCNAPVTGADFYPTILDLCELPNKSAQHKDGVSLVPLLKNGQLPDRPLIWHYPHYGNQGGDPCSIIRLGDWKLIHYYESAHEELYNLKNDLSETKDVSVINPEVVNKLHDELFDYLNEVGALFPQKDSEYNYQAEQEYQKYVTNELWPSLEKQREEMLSPSFTPPEIGVMRERFKYPWWGSMVTED